MNLLSLAHQILDRPMQRRFESDPLFKPALLLLQERIPKTSAFHKHVTEHSEGSAFIDATERSPQAPIGVDTPTPEVQLLSNPLPRDGDQRRRRLQPLEGFCDHAMA